MNQKQVVVISPEYVITVVAILLMKLIDSIWTGSLCMRGSIFRLVQCNSVKEHTQKRIITYLIEFNRFFCKKPSTMHSKAVFFLAENMF